jgi:predicted Zn-dependent peptidase
MEEADRAVEAELEAIRREPVGEHELEKVKNRVESLIAFEDMSLLSRCNNLAYYELLGDAELMNSEMSRYEAVTAGEMREVAAEIFAPEHSNTLYYYARN